MMMRPVHQRAPLPRVHHVLELHEGLEHLARALAARDDDHDVGGGVAGDQALQHRLAGAEGPGDAGGTALGDGETGCR
jgi:hypothetical protein